MFHLGENVTAEGAEQDNERMHPRSDESVPPQNEDGYYLCYRECEDETPCQRVTHFPWRACYQHFGQAWMETAEEENG